MLEKYPQSLQFLKLLVCNEIKVVLYSVVISNQVL